MSTKIACPTALLLTVLSCCPCLGQSSPFGNALADIRPAAHETVEVGTELPPAALSAGPSSWINYQRPSCCTHALGSCGGPLQAELFLRSGWTIPIGGGGVFEQTLSTGWSLQGGGRALFFNESRRAAWAAEVGITNMWNHASQDSVRVPLSVLVIDDNGQPQRVQFGGDPDIPGVTLRNLNRLFVNLGFGREWYFRPPAGEDGWSWRAGLDGGGRWGVASLELHELRRREDVIGGVYASMHTDLEVPMRSAILQFGFRMEWAYTWSDILQRQSDLMDITLLLTAGVRY